MRAFAALLLSLAAAPTLAAPLISQIGPGIPLTGPEIPLEGRSAFSEIFSDGVPFPFAALLDRLRDLGEVQTALIPLGRSLQRFSAHPDYFASPRLVVAVTSDNAGPDAPHLANRLYLGYQPAAEMIEAISYNEAAGRFEFEEIIGFSADAPRRIEPATRAICSTCHHGLGPIFARPLWSETNANPKIAARLADLGPDFHGAPVRQTVDALEAFDAATDAAARIPLANRLWSEGCATPPCRAALLAAALAFRLSGGRPDWRAADDPAFAERVASLWTEGLSTPGFDMPNRDPAALLGVVAVDSLIETEGAMNPETPRPPAVLWSPADPSVTAAAREIAAMLSHRDIAGIDARLARTEAHEITIPLDCRTERADRPRGGAETRFSCSAQSVELEGHIAGGAGRIDRLRISRAPALRNLRIDGEALTQPGFSLSPRIADGHRISAFSLDPARIVFADDFTQFAAVLAERARAGNPAFASGPFRRRAVLKSIMDILERSDG